MSKKYLLHDLDESEVVGVLKELSDDIFVFPAKPDVRECRGCFGCWIKTPGECITKDRCSIVPKVMAESDEMIIFSRLVYGGFSPSVKGVLDRSIGYMMPYFRIVNNEMHHTKRYDHSFKLTVHFYGDQISEREKELSRKVIAGNALNLGASGHQVFFHKSLQELGEVI